MPLRGRQVSKTAFDQLVRTAVVLTLISITGAMDFTADVIELSLMNSFQMVFVSSFRGIGVRAIINERLSEVVVNCDPILKTWVSSKPSQVAIISKCLQDENSHAE